jgi:hypothetical protein
MFSKTMEETIAAYIVNERIINPNKRKKEYKHIIYVNVKKQKRKNHKRESVRIVRTPFLQTGEIATIVKKPANA